MTTATTNQYKEIISSYYTQCETDREAEGKLETLAADLRRTKKDVVSFAKSSGSTGEPYLGVMFYGAIKVTDLKLLKKLEERKFRRSVLEDLRSGGLLQIKANVKDDAEWMFANHPYEFFKAIVLTNLYHPKKSWTMKEDEENDDR
jgi:hypothetical protein